MASGTFGAQRVAEVVAIGDELLHGMSIDTNSAHISRALEELGVEVRRFTVVSDEPAAMLSAMREACARSDLVIATGGLGPTEDDRTRAVAAEAAGVELRYDEASWEHIGQLFHSRKMTVPERNRVQAYIPVGAAVLRNDWGTAPGFAIEIEGALFAALPGVPREMRMMLAERVLPRVRERFGVPGAFAFWELRVVGLSEADLGDRLADMMGADRNPRVSITAHFGLLTVRIAGFADAMPAAEALCARDADAIRPLVEDVMIYEGNELIEDAVAQALIASGTTLALAESCTGGQVAAALTDVSGISEVFVAGFVTYSDAAKVRDLGVPEVMLGEHGAVSTEVAAAMAQGAAARAGARLAVSITGIAGPAGGTQDKPVGTVCFGLCHDGEVESWRCRFPDLGRRFIRQRSVIEALAAILRRLPRP